LRKKWKERSKKIFSPGKTFLWVKKTRRGIGLVLALVVVLACSGLVAFIFEASARFMALSTRQREVYFDHARATSYIEMAKGMVSDYNLRMSSTDAKEALHRPTRTKDQSGQVVPNTVGNARALQIPGIPDLSPANNLSLDISLSGRQAVTVQVYDVAYSQRDLAPALLSDDRALSQIPPPLVLLNVVSEDNGLRIEQLSYGEDNFVDTADPVYVDTQTFLDTDQIGAYLVRVELFDASVSPRRRIRLLEEAFFQVTSMDE
jgi:hypothetical protein